MSRASIDFYFDFISPFSYFAWVRLRRREAEGLIDLQPRPVVFGALLDHWGHKGPAEIPPKREFTWKTCLRFAAREGIAFQFPKVHPFNPLTPLRVALPEVSGREQKRVIDAIFAAGWRDGLDLGDPAMIVRALNEAGLDGEGMVQKTSDTATKEQLRLATQAAVQRGVFGVPTMGVRDELFWGNDQLETIDSFLEGHDTLDPRQLAEALARSAGVQRGARKAAKVVNETVAAIFARARFAGELGIELVSCGEGWCEAVLPLKERHLQQDGFAHAGVQATLADHTAGAAAGTMMPAGSAVLSIEFKINMLRPAVGDQLRCRATVLKAGRTISVVESEVYSRSGSEEKLASKATVTIAIRKA